MEGQIDKAQKHGQHFYREKDYQAALECFNSIIDQYLDAPLSVWDNRAAVYTKLGDLQAALRDGKQMIHIAKAQPTGYLRTGQILRLMGKEDVALGIYNYGLRNVPANHADFKLLRDMQDDLLAKSMPPKVVDPLLVLPLELAEMVIQYLSFRNIVGLLRVSKSWKHLVESMPSLWRHLDLSDVRKNVPKNAIKACVKRGKGNIDRVTLRRWTRPEMAPDILSWITSRCQGLDHLEIRDGFCCNSLLRATSLASKMTTLILGRHHETYFDTVTLLLAQCHALKRAEFHHVDPGAGSGPEAGTQASLWEGDCSNLKDLLINRGLSKSFQIKFYFRSLKGLLVRIPNIRKLTLRLWDFYPSDSADFSILTHLEKLDVNGFHLPFLPPLPTSLQSLDLTKCSTMDFSHRRSQHSVSTANLTKLSSFSVSDVKDFKTTDLDNLLKPSIGTLKNLAISNRFEPENTTEENGIARCFLDEYLQEICLLDLSRSEVDMDIAAASIALRSPRLKVLDVSHTNISGVGVKALVMKEGDKLEQLNLQYCDNVHIDAVEFARAKGVIVIFNFKDRNDRLKGKRKVESVGWPDHRRWIHFPS